MSEHPIVHIEISAKDRVAAANFYNDIFGWKVEQMPEMNYATFMASETLGGGFNPVSPESPAGTVLVYIEADDIEGTLAHINQHGGKTIRPKTEIPGIGWFAVFLDPTGNTMALYKALKPM